MSPTLHTDRNLYELGTYLPAVEQLQTWFCAPILVFIALLPDILVKVITGLRNIYKLSE